MHQHTIVTALGITVFVLVSRPLDASAQSPLTSNSASASTPQSSDLVTQRQLSNVPDDIGTLLRESDLREDAIFSAGPLAPLSECWQRVTGHLRNSARLDLGINYTAVYQRADTTVRGPRDASDGDFDFFGRWHLTGREDHWPGSLVFSSETRHRFSRIPPNDLNTGTVGGTIVGFGLQDFSLPQLYWEQGSYEDGLILRVGKMDPALVFDGGRYVSSNYAFLSPAFSDTLPMALPGAGIGLVGAVYPTESTYIVGGIHDANGKRTTAGLDTFFDEGEYFSAVEFGWFPRVDQPNEGMYHVTLWHTDARQNARKPSDRGVALTLEQPLGCEGDVVPFLRYAYADRGLNGIRQNLSIGLGVEDVLGQSDDVIGLAASWAQPSSGAVGDQYILESFYRFFITPNTHLTPDIQVVIDPANAPTKDSVTVFGLRIRTLY